MEIQNCQMDNQVSLEKREKLGFFGYLRLALADYQNAYENLKQMQSKNSSATDVVDFLKSAEMYHGVCWYLQNKFESTIGFYDKINKLIPKNQNAQGILNLLLAIFLGKTGLM